MQLYFIIIKLFLIINYSFVYALDFKQFLCDTFKICQREPTIYEICDIFNLDKSTYGFCVLPTTTPQTTAVRSTTEPSTTKYLEKYEVLNIKYNCSFNKNDETMLKEFLGSNQSPTQNTENVSNSNNLKINSFLFVGLTIILTYIL